MCLARLFIDLLLENVIMENQELKPVYKKIRRYKYKLDQINFEILDELYTKIIGKKGDWIALDCSCFKDTIIAKYYLIFHSNELSMSDREIINRILLTIDEFFKVKKLSPIDTDEPTFIQDVKENEDILYIECCDRKDLIKIESLLKQNAIPFEILSKHIRRFDGGCSDEIISMIISIARPIIGMLIEKPLSEKITFVIDNIKFKSLKKTIASIIGEDERNLALKEMHRSKNKIEIVFISKDKEIKAVCDSNYNIKKLKVN